MALEEPYYTTCGTVGNRKAPALSAELRLCDPRPVRTFHSEAWERIAVVKAFPTRRCATQLSTAAVFEGEHWDGSYTGAGLDPKHADKSGINKAASDFNSGYACPCLEEVLGKEVNIALFITSRRRVRNYLLFTCFDS